nr:hypothetical protein [Paenibacillus albidus]
MTQTQQASQMYQQLLQQEQQNAVQLEEIAGRERKAAQIIQNALHGHQTAMQQMQQISQICRQLEQSTQQSGFIPSFNPQPFQPSMHSTMHTPMMHSPMRPQMHSVMGTSDNSGSMNQQPGSGMNQFRPFQ